LIHATSIVEAGARIADGVEIGPWCEIAGEVEIGEGTEIGSHVVIRGPTRIGRGNRIYPFSSIGGDSQDKKYRGERATLEVGDGNVIREYCTINRGTAQGGGRTRVGSGNWIMAYVHIAHDCSVGDDVVMANGSSLAGHVAIDNCVTLGGFTLVHQFCRVGAYAFSAMGSIVLKDVPPFVMIAGNTARPHGLNTEGLRRRGFSPETIRHLRRAYKTLYKKGLTVQQAIAELEESKTECPEIGLVIEFVRASTRGVIR
jgi:UDP-N-acetylglucosamine acyltransferase